MKTRVSRKTGKIISLLGFGCMRLPVIDGKQESIDAELATSMVAYARDHGVNYFDTAYMYHSGLSETFIGNALRAYPRESFNLATKLPPWLVENEADIDRIFDEQLTKCRVDFFDYYLIHNVSNSKLAGIRKNRVIQKLNEKKQESIA